MAKRLTEKQKEEMIESFKFGKTLEFISEYFNCTKPTIIRNLKKNLGEESYKELVKKNKIDSELPVSLKKNTNKYTKDEALSNKIQNTSNFNPESSFIEIAPLEFEIENSSRKELSSIPLSEIDLPPTVYMVVDRQIELEVKFLKDYPDWQFLPPADLNRKTIEIFSELKTAKRFCNKEQKVIKVPNTNVFSIVAPILISRGISRIVSDDNLIALS